MATSSQPPELRHLDHVLVSERAIKLRTRKLADEINRTYRGKELTVIVIVNGALIFAADLLRRLRGPLRLDCLRATSYHGATQAAGKPVIVDSLKLEVRGQHVLLVDDILDTGNTLSAVRELLLAKQAGSVRTCVLLDKKARRLTPYVAEYVGFQIPDEFVVGYGLDFNERYRNLPCIGVLKPKHYVSHE